MKTGEDYINDAQWVVDELKEFGKQITINTFINSGTEYNPTITKSTAAHYALPIELAESDISDVILKTDRVYLVDGRNPITNDCTLTDGGTDYEILSSEVLNFDGATDILYRVIAR